MRVFFSYSRDDSSFALKLASDLRKAGQEVWIDQLDIAVGERWDRSVEKALTECPAFLIILSPTAVQSPNVMDEANYALEEGKKIVPILYEACELPFRLRRLQYVDFTKNYDDGLRACIAHLQDLGGGDGGGTESLLDIQANKCLERMQEIRAANERVVERGAAGSGPWKAIQTDTYNRVCRIRHERRTGSPGPDDYFDVVCNDPDVIAICDKKWYLGEDLETYRNYLTRTASAPRHEEFELLIRRSIVQPDCTPHELKAALEFAIAKAKEFL